MQAIGNRHPPYDRSGKCSMGQASHITGPRRCVRRNDNDMNAYDDYDGDDDENKKSNWLLHRSTNCCQNSSIRSQLSSHQALLLTADWWWCLLWEKKKTWTKPLRYHTHPEKPESNKNLHDLIIDQTSCDSEIVAWGQKADLFPFLVFLVLFWRNLCVVRILWITLAEIVACVEVAGVQKARLVSLRFSHANILSTLDHHDLILMMMRVIMMIMVIAITSMMIIMIMMMMMMQCWGDD